MENQKFQTFIDLVTFDQQFIDIQNQISLKKNNLVKLQSDAKALDAEFEKITLQKHELKKNLDQQELVVKELQEKEKRQTAVLDKATTPKEYDAGTRELDHIKVERDKQEQKLMQLWNKNEHAEKEYGPKKASHEEKLAALQQEVEKEQAEIAVSEKNIVDLEKSRESRVELVPKEWLNIYENMRGKVSDPVVQVEQESCSACFYMITAPDLQKLKKNQLLQCKDCYRFLYLEQEPAE